MGKRYEFMDRLLWNCGLIALLLAQCITFAKARKLQQDEQQGKTSSDQLVFGQVSTGAYHSCALQSSGNAFCWGDNFDGELGFGKASEEDYPPTQVASEGRRWNLITAGTYHSCGVQNDGTGWCWGLNDAGQLGTGSISEDPVTAPQQIVGLGPWRLLNAGISYTCGIKNDGSGYCWGDNSFNQLGQPLTGSGAVNHTAKPLQVSGGGKWTLIVSGYSHSCGIKSDGTGWCWGNNGYGQLGINVVSNASAYEPVPIRGTTDTWLHIAVGAGFTCGIDANRIVQCWGNGYAGELGTGSTEAKPLPTPVLSNSTYKHVAAGYYHACAIDENLEGWCWGLNHVGQLGNGMMARNSSIPTKVAGGHHFREISASHSFTCGLTTDNAIMCWGENSGGQLGVKGPTNSTVPIAIKASGAWGVDSENPLYNASFDSSSPPLAAIIGGVIGGVVFIALVTGAVLWRRKQNRIRAVQNKYGSSASTDMSEKSRYGLANDPLAAGNTTTMDRNVLAIRANIPTLPEGSLTTSEISSMGTNNAEVLSWVSQSSAVIDATTAASSNPLAESNTAAPDTAIEVPEEIKDLQFEWKDIKVIKPMGSGSFGKMLLAELRNAPVACKLFVDATVLENSASRAHISGTASSASNEPFIVAPTSQIIQEVQALVQLDHPNIGKIVGFCLEPPCIALEFYPRGSLYSMLQHASIGDPGVVKELTWSRRVKFACDAAAGMAYLHARSPAIVHRDLKSSNLLLTTDWTVKITDMGMSKLVNEAALQSGSMSTARGAVTARWLAPEVLDGDKHSPASDAYSFGIIMWELLTWKLPWSDSNIWTIVGKVLHNERPELPPLSNLPGFGNQGPSESVSKYIALMKRCWASNPSARPSFDEISKELGNL